MRRSIVLGLLAIVTLTLAGTVALNDSARWLWTYTFADVPTLPATVQEVLEIPGGMGEPPETELTLDVEGSTAMTYLEPADTERLGITGPGDEVTVTVFDRTVLDVTGPVGEVAESLYAYPTTEALLLFLAMAAVAMIAVAFVARWRRVRGTWPAVACAAVGVVLGVLMTTMPVGAGFAMPGLFGGSVVGGLVAALVWTRVGLRPPVTSLPATTDGSGRR